MTCDGEPVRVSICHCLECQRRTGSAFGVQARFPRAAIVVEGRFTEFVRARDDGGRVTSRFCPLCGSTVFYELEAVPGFVGVAVGAFADPSFPPPSVSIYEARRHAWAVMPELDAEHLD